MAAIATSTSGGDSAELDAALSLYEDAVDGNDEQLERMCRQALRCMHKVRDKRVARRQCPVYFPQDVMSSSSQRPNSRPPQSSSSDHSSIERVYADEKGRFRSREGTMTSKRSAAARKSNSDGSTGSQSGEWRLVNVAESNSYSALLQLSRQLECISKQLYDMETLNTLQLRLVYRILTDLIRFRKRPWLTSLMPAVPFPFLVILFLWPFVASCLKRFLLSNRKKLALSLYRYL